MKHNRVMNRRGGFTLIEMLVVAALIAIFAGLAVFNIVEELQREKSKAATAETRSIATAMSFAYQDLSWFPKLCFLKYGLRDLANLQQTESLTQNSYECYDHPVNVAAIAKTWSVNKYLAGSMPDKYCKMTINDPNKAYDWPRDPFNHPYTEYFIKMKKPTGGGNPYPTWIETAGDKADYFAGIVSYGRNGVPGLRDVNVEPDQTKFTDTSLRAAARLYTPVAGQPRNFTMLPATKFADQGPGWPPIDTPLGAFLGVQPGTAASLTDPGIREVGSDDVYYEF
jgi:prepilin-type N-terminal cleavage/methylation domain-containing protein